MSLTGKKLLVLGGTSATTDLVRLAKSMGVYTIVADYLPTGPSKEIADASVCISTTDYEGLIALIQAEKVDGVFCGPSEFNIRNLIRLCAQAKLPCYTTMDIWDRCANKDEFKQFCMNFDVDCPRRYNVDHTSSEEALDAIDYPVIVKPVDGNSSHGITVCMDKSTMRDACRHALDNSTCKRIIVEKYIDNGGELFGARYIIRDGEAFPYLLIDTYVADPIERKSLISHFTFTPSKYSDYYMQNMDAQVRKLLKGMGIQNGTAFFQALPYNGKIYFHEMGYRLSGGMLFKFTEPLMGVNDMKMMIRYALGGPICTPEEEKLLDVTCGGKFGAQLMIPLSVGTIASVEGLEQAKAIACVKDFIQYHHVGSTITDSHIGTLGQHFGRFTLIADSAEELYAAVDTINSLLFVRDPEGNTLNSLTFDLSRAK